MSPTPEIAPDDVLQPGTRDARRLLILWSIRRSAVSVFWLGLMVGVLLAPGNNVDVTYETPADAFRELASPAAGIALAILIRLGTSAVGVLLAAPVTQAFDAAGRARGPYSGRDLDRLSDRLNAARGYRSLRFSRYVRDAAVERLGAAGVVYDRIDHGFRIAAYVLPVVTIVVTALT